MKEWPYWAPLLFVFSLFLIWGMYMRGAEWLLGGENDFAPVYAATTLVGTPYMYDAEKIGAVIIGHFGRTNDS